MFVIFAAARPPAQLGCFAARSRIRVLLVAALVLADIYLLGYREHMKIMEAVWPLTALARRPGRRCRLHPVGKADVTHLDEGPRPRPVIPAGSPLI
jgi:hypothetical protein